MKGSEAQKSRAARKALGEVTRELAALQAMTVSELAARFEELFGFPTRTRNKAYLQKRLAWKIQERHEGGLSDRALARIEELAPLAPARWRRPSEKQVGQGESGGTPAQPAKPRDPRLPDPGTILQREHGGETHEVLVHDDDFEYRGTRYASLSQVAKAITGTAWNGYLFFRLTKRDRGGEEASHV